MSFVASPLMQTFSMALVMYGSTLVRLMDSPGSAWLVRASRFRALRSLGKYSYAMYLFHYFVGLILVGAFARAYQGPYLVAQLMFWTCTLGVTYGLAWVSWQIPSSARR
ncbi:MAG TPA: hypothetical protein VKM54_08600 [Myxococcota bacterium]|nr:hypothetical protein [Myxococcota bacterium]